MEAIPNNPEECVLEEPRQRQDLLNVLSPSVHRFVLPAENDDEPFLNPMTGQWMQPINSSRSSGPSNWHAPDMRKDLKWPEVPKTKFQSPQHTSTQVLLTGPTSQEDGAASSTAAIHTTEKKNVLEKTQKTELSSPRIMQRPRNHNLKENPG
jgi:hypothetical protein